VNDTIDGEIARYATAVRAAFADRPGPERELLLEDLEDHLQEVAAEAGGSLTERLGRPEAYAAELRASAGLPATGADAGRRRASLRESRAARRLAGARHAGLAIRPAGPWSSSCPSCGQPGGWPAATWPCRRSRSP
jgi:hypothetical protein